MLPPPGELLHFSEDPSIRHFAPHVAATAQQPAAYVWTVDALNAPCYRFPADDLEPFGERPHAHVATRPVAPLGPPVEVDDLLGLHEEHDIELRVLADLGDHLARVREVEPALEFSAIRMGNAGVGPRGPFTTRR
ncbi:DUF6886 family protein [Nocardioides sp.]|uniref:DUF6886 family protein n=1 Tax=Nocardioides sp. TaxID=35761 RepID=UPI00261BBD7D|nr:DUF6886 family protein [Nocardioides sp.]MCW2737452.1 hypothetical protein [Nocardioides sp.]